MSAACLSVAQEQVLRIIENRPFGSWDELRKVEGFWTQSRPTIGENVRSDVDLPLGINFVLDLHEASTFLSRNGPTESGRSRPLEDIWTKIE